MGNDRISASTLTAQVANLNEPTRGQGQVQLQFPESQMPQQVLSWLVRFQVRDQMAARNGITVTPGSSRRSCRRSIRMLSRRRPPAPRCR